MKDYTEIVVIVDRSGSMEVIREDSIGGFNAFVEDQKKVPGAANLTLVLFNNKYKFVLDSVPLGMVKPLDKSTYVPMGTTALLDAMGHTIDSVGDRLFMMNEADRPSKVIVAILTDGLENASLDYSRERIFEMVSHQREVYKWEFFFLAANQDAIQSGTSYGIPAAATSNFVADAEGTRSAYGAMSSSVKSARTGGKKWQSPS